jgi:hypothetical protein
MSAVLCATLAGLRMEGSVQRDLGCVSWWTVSLTPYVSRDTTGSNKWVFLPHEGKA